MVIILYARKSVERENSISCETQLEYCRSVIKPDEREEKIITFVDNGFSGGNVNRDGFQKMMKLVRQGKVKKVIVYKLDRISRSLSDFVNILQEFKEHKVEFVSSQESFDTSSPYGEMIVKLLMVFAEFRAHIHHQPCYPGIRPPQRNGVLYGRQTALRFRAGPDCYPQCQDQEAESHPR